MNYKTIEALQKANGIWDLQEQINSGIVWKFEGSVGRSAMQSLDCGECMLPKKATFDYYGSRLPSRDDLKKGTKGTFQNSVRYWQNVEDGSLDYLNY